MAEKNGIFTYYPITYDQTSAQPVFYFNYLWTETSEKYDKDFLNWIVSFITKEGEKYKIKHSFENLKLKEDDQDVKYMISQATDHDFFYGKAPADKIRKLHPFEYDDDNVFYLKINFDKDGMIYFNKIDGLPDDDIKDMIILVKSQSLNLLKEIIHKALNNNKPKTKLEVALKYCGGITTIKQNSPLCEIMLNKSLFKDALPYIIELKFTTKTKILSKYNEFINDLKRKIYYVNVLPMIKSCMFDYIISVRFLPKEFSKLLEEYINFLVSIDYSKIDEYLVKLIWREINEATE